MDNKKIPTAAKDSKMDHMQTISDECDNSPVSSSNVQNASEENSSSNMENHDIETVENSKTIDMQTKPDECDENNSQATPREASSPYNSAVSSNDEQQLENEATLEEDFAVCEYQKCRKKDLKKSFYGKKRFCSKGCAHACSASCRRKIGENKEVGTKKAATGKARDNIKLPSNHVKQEVAKTVVLKKTGKSKRKTEETDNSNSVQPTVEKKRRNISTSEKQEDAYAICEWHKCGVRKLMKDFIGTKRFCSTQCAHAFSGSRRYSGGKKQNKVKQEKMLVKTSKPRSKDQTQQISSEAVSGSQQEAEQIEAPADNEKDYYQRQFPDLPRQTDFWTEVFHNGFKCDYYNNYLDGQCHEILDRVYMILTEVYYQNAFKSVFEPLLEIMQRHEPELTRKNLTARKYEIFDEVIKIFMRAYNKYGVECYNLYSNNGTHKPNHQPDESKKDDLAGRLHSYVQDDLVNLLEFPSAKKISLDELQRCLQGLTDIVDSDGIFQTSMIMKIIEGYQIPLDPQRLLKKAVTGILNEIFKKQNFFAKRPKPATPKLKEKARSPGYLSDFSDGDW